MYKLMLLTIFGLLVNVFTYAEETSNQSTGLVSLLSVENWVSSEMLYIHASDNTAVNPAGCTITDRYVLPKEASTFSRSMVIAAYAAGHTLSFTIYNGSCINERPQVVSVKFESY